LSAEEEAQPRALRLLCRCLRNSSNSLSSSSLLIFLSENILALPMEAREEERRPREREEEEEERREEEEEEERRTARDTARPNILSTNLALKNGFCLCFSIFLSLISPFFFADLVGLSPQTRSSDPG
jgi:hypothetical protein